MTTAANRKTRLDAIMIARCQGDDTFVTFQLLGVFRFLKNGNSLFSKNFYNPSIFLGHHPLHCQVFRFALASSAFAILATLSTIE